jgi:tryptophanase
MSWNAHESLRECEESLRRAERPLQDEARRNLAASLLRARPNLELPEDLRGGTARPVGAVASWEARRLEERLLTGADRLPLLNHVRGAHFNPFNVLSSHLVLDMLTDSGTSRLTPRQERVLAGWERSVPPIETFAYARPSPKEQLNACVREVFGSQFDFYLATQGRGAEYILMQSLAKSGIIPPGGGPESGSRRLVLSNRPFDTTRGHIALIQRDVEELTRMPTAAACADATHVFLGNADTERLRQRLADSERGGRVDLVLMTLTDNGGGGQPVSMHNYRQAAEIAHEYGRPFWVDACRIFENAMFVHLFDSQYASSSLLDIVRKMLESADLVTISFKKMYAHSGGAVLVNRDSAVLSGEQRTALGKEMQRLLTALYGNGYDSYSGRTGRDMIEIISGLAEAADPDVIARRIGQTQEVGAVLRKHGLPVVVGGHALYVAADEVLPGFTNVDCPAEYLNALFMAACGIRGCGLGHIVYGGERVIENGVARWSKELPMDSLRWALPREQYTTAYYDRILAVVGTAYDNGNGVFKNLSPGFTPVGYADTGFYHFEAVYESSSEKVQREFDSAVRELHALMLARLR